MSYEKMMRWHRKHPKGGKAQYMGFSLIGNNERRKIPQLGLSWYEPGMKEKRAEFIRQWEQQTEQMLKENPNLKII